MTLTHDSKQTSETQSVNILSVFYVSKQYLICDSLIINNTIITKLIRVELWHLPKISLYFMQIMSPRHKNYKL